MDAQPVGKVFIYPIYRGDKVLARNAFTLVCVAVFVIGCGTEPVRKDQYAAYKAVPLRDAEIMPTEAQLSSEPAKVIVLDGEDGTDNLSRAARAGLSLSKAVSQWLGAKGVEIIDQNLAPTMGDSLRLAEAKGFSTYSGPSVANYVIKPIISRADYSVKYTPPIDIPDKKGKVLFTIPASYKHVGEIVGTIRIYEVPSLKAVSTLNIRGSKSFSDASTTANQMTGGNLLRAASEAAVSEARAEIMKVFAPEGFVGAKKVNGKRSIFQITLGRDNGIKPGDRIGIYSVRKVVGGFSKMNEDTEEVFIADALVSENMGPRSAWVEPINEDKARNILRGDLARPEYGKNQGSSLLRGLTDAVQNLR